MAQVRVPRSFEEAFHPIRAKLVEHVNLTSSLVRQLLNNGLLNQGQAEKIEKIPTLHDRANTLLQFLQRADDRKVDVFLSCLTKCEQQHVSHFIVHRNEEILEPLERQRTVIRQKFDELVLCMDPHSELLDKLVPLRVFAEEVIEEIRAEKTRRRRNEKILDHLLYVDKDGYSNFLRALNDSSQTHVVNFINENEVDDEWPLSASDLDILKSNYSHLVDFLAIDTKMLALLYQRGCITHGQMNHLASQHTAKDRNREMLEILRRRSVRSYRQFICCLKESKCNHMAVGMLGHDEDSDVWRVTNAYHNRSKLVKLFHLSQEILNQMVPSYITDEQGKWIVSRPTREDKNRAFFDALEQQGLTSFKQVVRHLKDRGQNNALVWVLEHEGVLAECAVELDVEDLKKPLPDTLSSVKDDVETRICNQYSPAKARLQSDIQLIAFEKFSYRFSAFLMNSSRDDLARLTQSYFCGRLKDLLSLAVKSVVPAVRIKHIDWSVKDFDRCNKYFLTIERLQECATPHSPALLQTPPPVDLSRVTIDDSNDVRRNSDPTGITWTFCSMHRLSVDLLGVVLIKSVGLMFGKCNALKYRDAVARSLGTVNSVCLPWWTVLTGRTIHKRQLRHCLDRICRPYRRVIRQQYVMPFREEVMGIAILHGKMYVIFDHSPVVRVFDADCPENDMSEDILIPAMEWPHAIVASSEVEKLYIADMQNSEAGCVWGLSSDGDSRKYLPSSQEPEKFWPRSVATANGQLLVVSFHPNLLLMYAIGGRRVCKLELPRDMQVEHAVVTNHNTFLVGLSRAENTLFLLRELNFKGTEVRRCSVEFILPVHIALHPTGDVLVADRSDDKVVALDAQLRLKRVLLHKELSEPRRLLLQPQRSQLIVSGLKKLVSYAV